MCLQVVICVFSMHVYSGFLVYFAYFFRPIFSRMDKNSVRISLQGVCDIKLSLLLFSRPTEPKKELHLNKMEYQLNRTDGLLFNFPFVWPSLFYLVLLHLLFGYSEFHVWQIRMIFDGWWVAQCSMLNAHYMNIRYCAELCFCINTVVDTGELLSRDI